MKMTVSPTEALAIAYQNTCRRSPGDHSSVPVWPFHVTEVSKSRAKAAKKYCHVIHRVIKSGVAT